MLQLKLKSTLAIITVLYVVCISISSCKKEIKEKPAELEKIQLRTQSLDPENLSEFIENEFIPQNVRDSIVTTDYHYFYDDENDSKLWIISLESGFNGWYNSKIVTVKNSDGTSTFYISYDYDEEYYRTTNFYTGITSIFYNFLEEEHSIFYKDDIIYGTAPIVPELNALIGPPPSEPPFQVSWCYVLEALCNHFNNPISGSTIGYLMQSPPEGAGGGGSNGPAHVVTKLNSLLSLTTIQTNWLNQNLKRAYQIFYYLVNNPTLPKSQQALNHINRMISDPNYLNFVLNHESIGNSSLLWWEDGNFLQDFGGIPYGTWAIEYLTANSAVSFSTFQKHFMTVSEGLDDSYDESFWDNPTNTFTPQNLPTWAAFEAAFPKRSDPLYNTSSELYISIGGDVLTKVGTSNSTNTCAARVSKALNYSGITIPHIQSQTFQGSDGKYYFIGAANLNRWMRKTFGCANPNTAIGEYSNSNSIHYNANEIGTNGSNLAINLSGIQGIFTMVSSDYSWATGHTDLMDPVTSCDGGCHFDGPVLYIDVWILQ